MENCFDSAGPLLRVGNFIGFFPMSFRSALKKGNLKVCWFGVARSCCLVSILILVNVANIINGTTKSNLLILSTVWKVLFAFQHVTHFMILTYQLLKRENIVEFLTKLVECDVKVRRSFERIILSEFYFSQLRDVHVFMDHRKHRSKVIRTLVVVAFITVIITAVDPLIKFVENGAINFYGISQSVVLTFFRTVVIAQFSFACTAVETRLKALNQIMGSSLSSKLSRCSHTKMVKCCSAFVDLSDLIEVVNKTFTFHFIPLLANILVREIFKLLSSFFLS